MQSISLFWSTDENEKKKKVNLLKGTVEAERNQL